MTGAIERQAFHDWIDRASSVSRLDRTSLKRFMPGPIEPNCFMTGSIEPRAYATDELAEPNLDGDGCCL